MSGLIWHFIWCGPHSIYAVLGLILLVKLTGRVEAISLTVGNFITFSPLLWNTGWVGGEVTRPIYSANLNTAERWSRPQPRNLQAMAMAHFHVPVVHLLINWSTRTKRRRKFRRKWHFVLRDDSGSKATQMLNTQKKSANFCHDSCNLGRVF